MSQTQFKAEIYRDARQEFRWRVRASNGRVVADGAEGYVNRADCARMLAMLCRVAEVEHLVEARRIVVMKATATIRDHVVELRRVPV